ncbi:DNA-binding transcriptional regulator, MarR family [Saccharopolyspora kobensis]|uniref:DNA-binding transcriptional regulator, MarR family n=1 Tax=Saccharopolyspora kobensis TaxID=146035 RepID=A0A1H6DJN6_9PSEU|nr:MarR family transcriptional regulator [Saccharopolyspora kobensis]SEG85394.1 DNA-binding transcriptional regulator, MarR family [Saccharopolyspora kobensis]SFD24313.1 DNA-binding transcriptional regulator, MarR family [Saccharopolyspora kobensis]
MGTEERPDRAALAAEITGPLSRRYSTATVLYHHALAERLGLGPTDLKCLDLLHERAPMTASELAAITGLTTGATTGVVARLERSGLLAREPHPHDRRKQVLRPTAKAVREVQAVFDSLPVATDALVEGFDAHQLTAISEFLTRVTDFAYQRGALLRAQALSPGGHRATASPEQDPEQQR